jgi:hypothetical protein
VFIGTFVGSAITPQLRLGWDVTIVQQTRGDALTFMGELGGGYGVKLPSFTLEDGTPSRVTFLFQYTAVAGLGYRGNRGRLHWGIQVGIGPLYYGARFDGQPTERYVVATVEGRVELGWKVSPRIVVGASAGISSPLTLPSGSLASPFIGGALLGLFVSWR